MNNEFKGKNVLVTGGSKNIGKGIVESFLERGANVVFTYHSNDTAAEKTYQQLISKAGGHLSYVKANCASYEDCEATFDHCLQTMGAVDFLVNNAANLNGCNDIRKQDKKTWDDQIQMTLTSVFMHCRRMVNDCIKDGRHGRIVNVSSKASVSTKTGIIDYAAAKAGVSQLTHVMGQEVAKYGVLTYAILPGFVIEGYYDGTGKSRYEISEQAIGPTGKVACPRDMGEMVAALCGDAGNYAVGSVIDLTGGRLLQ